MNWLSQLFDGLLLQDIIFYISWIYLLMKKLQGPSE